MSRDYLPIGLLVCNSVRLYYKLQVEAVCRSSRRADQYFGDLQLIMVNHSFLVTDSQWVIKLE